MSFSKPVSLTAHIPRFIDEQEGTEATKNTYTRALRQWKRWGAPMSLNQYKRCLMTQPYAPSTINSYLNTVKYFFNWANLNHLYTQPVPKIKLLQKSMQGYRTALSKQNVQNLLSHIDVHTFKGLRDFALLQLMIYTGLRTIEVERAIIGDIKDSLLYIQGKGRLKKDEFVVLPYPILQSLHAYWNKKPRILSQDPLFTGLYRYKSLTTRSIRRIIKGYFLKTGINDKQLTTHSLRHTAITMALLAGSTLQEVQAFARHKDINTTLIYAHNVDRLKQAPEQRICDYLQSN